MIFSRWSVILSRWSWFFRTMMNSTCLWNPGLGPAPALYFRVGVEELITPPLTISANVTCYNTTVSSFSGWFLELSGVCNSLDTQVSHKLSWSTPECQTKTLLFSVLCWVLHCSCDLIRLIKPHLNGSFANKSTGSIWLKIIWGPREAAPPGTSYDNTLRYLVVPQRFEAKLFFW